MLQHIALMAWTCRGLGQFGVFLSASFYREKGNRGLGQSGTWAFRRVGIGFTIGDLGLSRNWIYRGFGYRGVLLSGIWAIGDLGNRGLGPIGELGLDLQSGTWACRGVGSIGDFVIGEFLSGKRLSGTWAIGLTS